MQSSQKWTQSDRSVFFDSLILSHVTSDRCWQQAPRHLAFNSASLAVNTSSPYLGNLGYLLWCLHLYTWYSSILTLKIPAAAKSLQSCPTLCKPIDSSPPGSAVPGILQARTLEWGAISFSNAGKWKVKVKVVVSHPTLHDPMDFKFQQRKPRSPHWEPNIVADFKHPKIWVPHSGSSRPWRKWWFRYRLKLPCCWVPGSAG